MLESVEMIIRQPGHPDRVVRLQEGATRLGRSEDCEIVLSDVGVSRRHARLLVARDQVHVEDLGSGNGTYYRGRRVEREMLHDGDEVVIDPFVLQFRIRGDGRDQPDDPTLDGPLARLDVLHGPGLRQSSYVIPPQGLTLGRSETRDIVIPDPASSRHHCSVFFQDGQYILRDMGSANGVYVNAYRVKESILTDGDRVQIGNTEMRFVLDDATKAEGGTPRPGLSSVPSTPPRRRENASQWGTEISLPSPEHGRGGGGFMAWALGGATLLTLTFLLTVVSGALVFLVIQRTAVPKVATNPSGPPTWVLEVGDAPKQLQPKQLADAGIEAMRRGDHRAALRSFYFALNAKPDAAGAESFAFVAGEYVVLGALQPTLDINERARLARERRRTELLDDAQRAGRRGRVAADTLASEFRNDKVVQKAMSWAPSTDTRALQTRLAEAAEAQTRKEWLAAAEIYEQVLAATDDEEVRTTARGGLQISRRELARLAADDWRAGVVAEEAGDVPAARAAYGKVLAIDPGNPSAKARLARLAD